MKQGSLSSFFAPKKKKKPNANPATTQESSSNHHNNNNNNNNNKPKPKPKPKAVIVKKDDSKDENATTTTTTVDLTEPVAQTPGNKRRAKDNLEQNENDDDDNDEIVAQRKRPRRVTTSGDKGRRRLVIDDNDEQQEEPKEDDQDTAKVVLFNDNKEKADSQPAARMMENDQDTPIEQDDAQQPTSTKKRKQDRVSLAPSVYDHEYEIPSDAEEDILQAAQASSVPVNVVTQTKRKSSNNSGNNHSGNNTSNSKTNNNNNNNNKTSSVADEGRNHNLKSLYTAGDHLPVLSQPQEMFDDMVQHLLQLNQPFVVHKSNKATAAESSGNKTIQSFFVAAQSNSDNKNKKSSDNHTASSSKLSAKNAQKLLLPLLQTLQDRPLRVATMCSGTESPLLALDMLQKAVDQVCVEYGLDVELRKHKTNKKEKGNNDNQNKKEVTNSTQSFLQIEHVFSCEIEPFKQAYIERCFQPPLLFRDIRELGQDEAHTAYGALAKVPNNPGDVDILIAGTSCVDYSNLNNRKKTIDQKGESGQTFWGMMDWIDKTQPPIVVLENVVGAPWETKVKIFEERGYSANFRRLDTKDYYIPHTRQRGYLFAVKKTKAGAKTTSTAGTKKKTKKSAASNDMRAKHWDTLLGNLKRPASASLDAFMLPNDDPRVLRGRARLTAESLDSDGGEGAGRAGRTDWTKCETRHQYARASEMLGDQRPLTGWSDASKTVMPSFAWNDWVSAQVNRIHDLLDINTLRLARGGIDGTYKTMVWNLSQNVDRDTMGKLGLCQCLTPTGVPYVTNRGGPLVGEELLLLQGIPVDDLQFTKESEANLKDLAGNAMSTTVVGAVTLCALVLGHESLAARPIGKEDVGKMCHSLVPRPLRPPSDVRLEKVLGQYKESTLDLGPQLTVGVQEWEMLLRDAHWSSRMCYSEGASESLPVESLMICSDCRETCAAAQANPPRRFEEHNFVELTESVVRKDPMMFKRELLRHLPMLCSVRGVDVESLPKPDGTKAGLWKEWKAKVKEAVQENDGKDRSFRLSKVTRTREWTCIYKSHSTKARLEAHIHRTGVTWLLFAEAPLNQDGLRAWLEKPVARLVVPRPNAVAQHLTFGEWEFCLPMSQKIDIAVRGTGAMVNSWRSRIGLKGEFETEKQFEELDVSVASDGGHGKLAKAIGGRYKILPKCGGACGSLMKRVDGDGQPVFLFLESGRKRHGKADCYVFSKTCHRTEHNEFRDIHLRLSNKFNPIIDTSAEDKYEDVVQGFTPGDWKKIPGSSINHSAQDTSDATTVLTPVGDPQNKVKLSMKSWRVCPEILSCTVPLSQKDKELAPLFRNDCVELNLAKGKAILESLAFVTSRLSIPEGLSSTTTWIQLDRGDLEQDGGDDAICSTCAPRKPETIWSVIESGKKRDYLPVEDGRQAASFERALKNRPPAWVVRLSSHISSSSLKNLSIGCNVSSLVQRAYGYFPLSLVRQIALDSANSDLSETQYEFRLVPHIDRSTSSFDRLKFSSNKRDLEAKQPPNFKRFPLRKEQLRSLHWMLQQESSTDPFYEQEVCEEILPGLGWRAEGRVRRPVLCRGGIIADEVGYGKTAITLGLIDSAKDEVPEPPKGSAQQLIATKATLVVVPGHLLYQWKAEVQKFLSDSRTVVCLDDMKSISSTTIGDIMKAHIVLVSFKVLCNENYFHRLARLAGINPDSFPTGNGGKGLFDAVYEQCLSRIPKRVCEMKEDSSTVFSSIEKDAANLMNENTSRVRLDGKKAVYKSGSVSSSTEGKVKAAKLHTGEKDPWGFSSFAKTSYKKAKSPLLEAFFWRRVVVDEFTYLVGSERERLLTLLLGLKSSFRWCLSGTPGHHNFSDIRILASLLGIHLGVDEGLPGQLNSKGKEKTGLEALSQFLESRSMQWHERRHSLAQSFMDRFVRQNIAEIDEIPSKEHVYRADLPPAERAINLELETYLKSLDMNSKTATKSKKKSSSDRESRMQKVLRESDSAEEALLKGCTHYDMDDRGSSAAVEKMNDIIHVRKTEMKRLERELIDGIASCFRQHHHILSLQPDWNEATRLEKREVPSALNAYLSDVEESRSVSQGADKQVHERLKVLAKLGEAAFKADPDMIDERFKDVNEGDRSDDDNKKQNDTVDILEKLYPRKKALQNYLHTIRALGKELCGRLRSLRFVEHIHSLQGKDGKFECPKCKRKNLSVDDVAIFSVCGHLGCLKCLEASAAESTCIQHPHCAANVSIPHVVSSKRLNLDIEDEGGKYGRKLTAVVEKVTQIVKTGDRVLVFSQFDDLKDKVLEALTDSKLKTIQVKGSVKQQAKALSVFQKDDPGRDDPRVLLLKMDDEQSAGLNLTNLNHAVFVHPLLAGSQSQYDAYETQAIGRIRRYGQKKTVHVHRFLVNDTIDTEIYLSRGGRDLAATTGVV